MIKQTVRQVLCTTTISQLDMISHQGLAFENRKQERQNSISFYRLTIMVSALNDEGD